MRLFSKSFIMCMIISLSMIIFTGCGCSQEIKVQNIAFDSPVVDLFVGDIYEASANVIPTNAQNQKVVYRLENPKNKNGATIKVLERSESNKFVAVSPGEATIYATAAALGGSSTIAQSVRVFPSPLTLGSPTGLKYDGEKVVWDKVSYTLNEQDYDALGYIVNINGEEKPISANSYFADLPVGVENIIKVKASQDGSRFVYDSEYSTDIKVYILNTPTNITRNGTTVSWNEVEFASSYDIFVNGELYIENVTTNSIDVDFEESGNYALTIRANPASGSEFRYSSKLSGALSIEKLDSVQNLSVNNNIAMWNEVVKAVEYKVVLENENTNYTYDTGVYTNFDLSTILGNILAGEYNLSIIAVSNTTTGLNSQKCEPITLTKLSAPTNLRVENNALVWDSVEGAISYALTVNGGEIISVEDFYTLPEDSPAGEYVFKMIAYGDGVSTLTSNWTDDANAFTAIKLPAPTSIANENNTMINNLVTNASGYAYYDVFDEDNIIEITGDDIEKYEIVNDSANVTITLHDKIIYGDNDYNNFSQISNNKYVIKVKALGEDGGCYFNSNLSEVSTEFYRLPTPTYFAFVNPNVLSDLVTFVYSNYNISEFTLNNDAYEILSLVPLDDGQFKIKIKFQQLEDGKLIDRFVKPLSNLTNADLRTCGGGDIYISICFCGNGTSVVDSEYCPLSKATRWNYDSTTQRWVVEERSENFLMPKLYEVRNLRTNGTTLSFDSINDGEEMYKIFASGVDDAVATSTNKSIDLSSIITTDGQLTFTIVSSANDNTINNNVTQNGTQFIGVSNENEKFRFESNAVEFKVSRLDAPYISLDGGYITWTAIDNADKYDVYVNGHLEVNPQISEKDGKIYYYCTNYSNPQLAISVVAVVNSSNDASNLLINSLESNTLTLNRLVINSYSITDDVLTIDTSEQNVILNFAYINGSTGELIRIESENMSINLSETIKTPGAYGIGFYLSLQSDVPQTKLNSYFFGSVTPIEIRVLQNPIISYNGNTYKVSYLNNDSASGYRIAYRVKGEENYTLGAKYNANECDLSLFADFVGDITYEVTVIATGNDVNTISSYPDFTNNMVEFVRKVEPNNLTGAVDGNNYVLTWGNVPNATYKLFVNGAEIASVNTNTYSYALSNMSEAGVYSFTVRSIDANNVIAPSKYSSAFVVTKLNSPIAEVVNGEVELSNYDSQICDVKLVVLDSSETQVYSAVMQVGTINLDNITEIGNDNYKIVIQYIGDNVNYINSESITLQNISRTQSVNDLTLSATNRRLEWTSVPTITSYKVVYENNNGTIINEIVTTNYTTITDECPVGYNTVKVYSIGNDSSKINALASNSVSFTKLETPTNVSVVNGTLIFDKVGSITTYEVKVVKNNTATTDTYTYDNSGYQLDLTNAGVYDISVRAKGDYISNINSSYSEDLQIERLAKVQDVSIANGIITWSGVANAEKYRLVFTGASNVNIEVTTNVYAVEIDKFIAGNYNLSIVSVGNDVSTLSSQALSLSNFMTILSTPSNIEFNDDKYLVWDSVPNALGYVVIVTNSNNEIVNISTTENSVLLPSTLANGDYSITVKAVGNGQNIVDSDISSILNITKLRTPFGISHKENVLTVDGVNGIDKYIVVITNEQGAKTELVVNAPNLTTNYAFADAGEYSVAVKSAGNYISTIDSELTTPIKVRRLSAPTINLQNNVVTFEENIYATRNNFGYSVVVSKNDTVVYDEIIFNTSVGFDAQDFTTGNYKVSVKVLAGEQIEFLESAVATLDNIVKFASPVIDSALTNNKITWTISLSSEEMLALSGYEVKIVNESGSASYTTINNANIKEFELGEDYDAGVYIISVRALGDGQSFIYSNFSNEKEVCKLARSQVVIKRQDENSSTSPYIATWAEVENATSYVIVVNGTEIITTTSNSVLIDTFNSLQTGENTIRVKAIGDNTYYISGKVSQSSTFVVLDSETANLSVEEGVLVWEAVENAKLYLLLINDKVVNVSSELRYELGSSFNYGLYTVKIKVIAVDNQGTENVIVNSLYSDGIECYKLQTPKSPKIVNGMIEFEQIEYKPLLEGNPKAIYEIVYGNYNENVIMGDTYLRNIYSDMVGEDCEIKYRAIGDTYNLNSDWSNMINRVYGKELPQIEEIYMTNGTLQFSSVANASAYKVVCKNLNTQTVIGEQTISTTYLDRPFHDEIYDAVGVRYLLTVCAVGTPDAVGEARVYTNSKGTDIEITYLPQATNIQSREGVLTWSGTSSNGYVVEVDGVQYPINTQQFNFADITTGKHTVRIYLKGNGKEIIDGQWSNPAVVYKIDTPVIYATTFLKDGKMAWKTPNDFLSEYGVYDIEMLELFKYANLSVKNSNNDNNVITKSNITTTLVGSSFESVIESYFDDLVAGTYTFRLRNVGTTGSTDTTRFISSIYSNEFNVTVLNAPTNVRIENGILKWKNVENNDGYLVNIGENQHLIQASQNDDTCKLDLNNYAIGTYTITIRTIGDSTRYLTSSMSEEVEITILRAPIPGQGQDKAITVIDGSLTWFEVDKALSYNIKVKNTINDQENIFEQVDVKIKDGIVYYDLPDTLPAGHYKVWVMSNGDGITTISSKYTEEDKEVVKLPNVAKFGNTLGRLSFEQVENEEGVKVTNYKIYIKSSTYTIDQTNEFEIIASTVSREGESASISVDENGICYYALPTYIPSGNLQIKVKALGTTDGASQPVSYASGSYTSTMTAVKLEAVNDLFIQDGLIKWTYSGIGRSGFYLAIKDDGVLDIAVNELITTYYTEFPSNMSAKEYKVYVMAVGNTVSSDEIDNRYLSSDLSNELSITKLPTVNGFAIDNGMIVWEEVEGASNYELGFFKENQNKITIKSSYYDNVIGKYVFEPIGLNSEEQEIYSSGNYTKITVRALGGSNYINSREVELTNILKISRPGAPEVVTSSEGGLKLRWQISTYRIDNNMYLVKKYRIKLVSQSGFVYTKYISYDGDFTASTLFEYDLSSFDIGSGNYLLSIQACAQPRLLNGEELLDVINSDYSINVSITKPDAPSNLIYDNTLKAYKWSKPNLDPSLTVSYEVAYIYSNTDFSNVSENDFIYNINVNKFVTFDNYFYPTKLGYYKIVVKAIVSGSLSSDYIGRNGYGYVTYKSISDITDEELNFKTYIKSYGVDCAHNLFESGEGTLDNPYRIKNATQLNNLNYYYLSEFYFELINDINANNTNITIGSKTQPFAGELNGNNFTIRGLALNGTNDYIGLFSYASGATIKNLKIDANVVVSSRTSDTCVGLLVGYGENINLENILVKGSIVQSSSGNITATFYIGGAVGRATGESTSMIKVKNTATITSSNDNSISYVGGIVGRYSAGDGTNSGIINCGNEANVSGTNVGGIVGFAECPITNAYNTGSITGKVSNDANSYVGGIVGRVGGSSGITIQNVYNIGNVSATSNNRKDCYAGGVAGYGIIDVRNFYNRGTISSTKVGSSQTTYGWLIGYNFRNESIAENCYNINPNIAIISGSGAIYDGCYTIDASELNTSYGTYLNENNTTNNFTYSIAKQRVILVMENDLLV